MEYFSSGLTGHRRTYRTILERAWSANFKMVWYVLLRPLRLELNGQDPLPICRHWKDHFKSDLRSDQDHRLKKDLRSDQDHIF
jgi:hypothetical protein